MPLGGTPSHSAMSPMLGMVALTATKRTLAMGLCSVAMVACVGPYSRTPLAGMQDRDSTHMELACT